VNTRLKQLFHGDVSQNTSLLNCILCGQPARSGLIPLSAPVKAGGKIVVPIINRPTRPRDPRRMSKPKKLINKKQDGPRPSR